jgi:hypothetical protein
MEWNPNHRDGHPSQRIAPRRYSRNGHLARLTLIKLTELRENTLSTSDTCPRFRVFGPPPPAPKEEPSPEPVAERLDVPAAPLM